MHFNLPNLLTLSRILVIPVVVAVLLLVEGHAGSWIAFSAYAAACVTDFFDGYLARVWGQQSSFGRFLDPIADKLLVAAVLLMVVDRGRVVGVDVVAAEIILCREILVSGLREFLAEIRIGVPVTNLAKWKTTIQMLALGFLLVGEAGPDFFGVSTTTIGIVGLWAAAVLTLVTGYDYLQAGLAHLAEEEGSTPPHG